MSRKRKKKIKEPKARLNNKEKHNQQTTEYEQTKNRVINEKNHLQRPKKDIKQMREHTNTLFDIKNNK